MSKAPNILICDDDPVVHQSLALYLDAEEFTHADAYDGEQALSMIDKTPFDLMVLDQMMPGLSGMEVCQAIRRKSQLPIIMLTAVSYTHLKRLQFLPFYDRFRGRTLCI